MTTTLFNAADALLSANLAAGRGDRIAYVDDSGPLSYAALAERVNRFGNALLAMGLRMEDRVVVAMQDTNDWPVAFLGAIKAGIVPIAANTLLTASDYAYLLADSRARALVVSPALKSSFDPLIGTLPFLQHVLVPPFDALLAKVSPDLAAAPTTRDDACFWLYSSGSTGRPKGTVHVQTSMAETARLYGSGVLGIRETDLVFSAAKLFFAYGLGNALSFPLTAGASTLLMAERPTPASVFKRLVDRKPTVFYGVPTLYAALLANPDFPSRDQLAIRLCVSAGEALPADIGRRWKERTGVDILDGIGSTEMLHIFISNRPDDVRYGTSGKPVDGYEARVQDEQGAPSANGEIGDLFVRGPSAAAGYWNQREKSRDTFQGEWTRTGDKYVIDAEGYYTYAGRSDDMLKVSGMYVSPFEVEAALQTHPAVLEAAVVGKADESDLVKPKAFVVLKPGSIAGNALADDLQRHVKGKLAPYKYPRWIEFVPELPKTATGKIQRFKLRQ